MPPQLISDIFFLLIAFQCKHYLADYIFQTRWMLGKFNVDWSFFFPLAAHAGVHASLTWLICTLAAPAVWWLALVDGSLHFVMDRVKAGPRWLGRYNDRDAAEYWVVLGFDQMVHHLTDYYVIYRVIGALYP